MIQDFLQYDFLRNSLYAGILIGLVAPLIGVFVVIRRMSLIADALSHVTLSGIAASLSAGMGIGVIFISLANGFNTDLFSYLFGSVSAVTSTDLIIIGIVAIVVIVTITLLYKELFLLSFDEEYAVSTGLSAKWIHFIFIILVALVIAVSMRVVGVLLVSSLMTLPVAASIRIANGFKQTIFFSILFGEIAVIGGMFASYQLDLAPGGTIVMIAVLILIGAILWKKKKTA